MLQSRNKKMASSQHSFTIDDQPLILDERDMDIKIETDKFGKTIKYMMFKGTHWVFEMVNMLLSGKAETIQSSKAKHHLEVVANGLSKLPSPRFIDTHFRLSDAPEELTEKKCKIIYTLRDPRDVAVSLYHAYVDMQVLECECSFEGFLYLFLEGKVEVDGVFHHWLDAEEFLKVNPDIPVYFNIYEETLKNPQLAVQRLSDFLGLPRNDELCHAIADKCHISNMKRDKEKFAIKVYGKNILYRKGTVGDWKNYFTDQMLEDYYRVYEEKLAGSRFYQLYARNA